MIKKYNYPVPNLHEIDNDGASLEYNSDLKRWTLEVDDVQWMDYGETTHTGKDYFKFSPTITLPKVMLLQQALEWVFGKPGYLIIQM
jgi:hypothetical protein